MARKSIADIAAWPALSLEGNLISPSMIAAIDKREAGEQDEASYQIRKGLTIRDEISLAFRVGQAHFNGFARLANPSHEAAIRFARDFLSEAFGFIDLAEGDEAVALTAGAGRVPVVVVPPSDLLDRRSAALSNDRARSAALVLQDRLNADDGALWGLATNGATLRLMRDNASLTRPANIEANLAQIFETEDMASFAALWLLIHRSRFGKAGTPATDCALERWRDAGAKAGEAARDRLAAQVEQALKLLGSGFLEANKDLRDRLATGEVGLTEWFNELLRLVYRLIFLMVAEDRDLLHPDDADGHARQLYAQGYGLTALREHSARRASRDRHHDRYEGMKIVFRALAAGEPRLGLPALGGLFSQDQLPTLGAARLANRAFLSAVFKLGWLTRDSGLVPVNWQAMETEELGSVYESLLELQPQLTDDGRTLTFATHAVETKGNQRKTTGSYYTPDSLVQLLLDTTLDPVLDRAETEAADPAEALLKLTVIDPACGSGHFLLAAARRIATRLARHRANGNPSAADFRHALRDVASRCLYGVDRNPMAVELTKVALWIEALEPGRPLGFLDAQIRCGDSLIGVFDRKMLRQGLPDEAYKALTGDDKNMSRRYARLNKEQRDRAKGQPVLFKNWSPPEILANQDHRLKEMPQDELAEVEAKGRSFGEMRSSEGWQRLKSAGDLYVSAWLYTAAFFSPKSPGAAGTDDMPLTEHVWQAAGGEMVADHLRKGARRTSGKVGAFHWFIEYPEIMERDGGFDVVIGNPPWERIKLQEQEFFAARSPAIAGAPNKAERQKLIDALEMADPDSADGRLWREFQFAKRTAEAASEFARSSGRYPLTGRGDINTYALFAELFSRLAKPGGRAGVIVPTGIATDSSTSLFFGDLVAHKRLAQLIDFENREAIFPGVHRSYKFCVLGMGPADEAEFAFFLTNTRQLGQRERRFTLSPDEIARINPNTKTAPVFRSRADAGLTAKLYARAPVLIEERPKEQGGDINPWGITFQRMFDMSGDSGFFRTPAQLEQEGWTREGADWVRETAAGAERRVPLYEAKMIHHFDHRWATYAGAAGDEEGARDCTLEEKRNAAFEPSPRYWVPEREVRLRAARVPSGLKRALREESADRVLKALAEWLTGYFMAAEGRTMREADLFRVLGKGRSWNGILGKSPARFLMEPKIVENGAAAQSETPLTPDDIDRIARGPDDPLALGRDVVDAKQPRWLMGWRDICRSTDERTVIASVFPKVGTNHKVPLFYLPHLPRVAAALLANITALPFDYVARQKIGGTSLTYFYLKQFPVLPPSAFSADDLAFITPLVLELTYTSHAMKPWAEDLGYFGPPFAWDEERRAHLRAGLDAFFAKKYGLTRDELRYVLDPAKARGADYPSETFRVLKEKEIARHGEYRTERLVLEAWDRMEADGTFRALGLDVPGTVAAPAAVELPPLEGLRDGAWSWPTTIQPRDRLRYAAQYALWLLDSADDGTRTRFLIAGLAEPALLTPWLQDAEQAHWIRLVGPEARPAQGVTRLRPQINEAWRSMFQALVASGQMEERSDGGWMRGRDFDPTGLVADSADAQRAAFALRAVRGLDIADLTTAVAPEDNVVWMRFGRA